MNWLEAFILGIIQGLTEFLPISSTGHLYLGRHLFQLDEAGLFLDTMLHIGTLLAVFIYYKKEFIYLIKNPFSKLMLLLIVGTIPAVVIGLLFKDFFEDISKTGITIGWEFLVTGLFLYMADKQKNGRKKMNDITYKDAFIIGSFQAASYISSNFSFWNDNCRCIMEKVRPRNSGVLFIFIINTSYCRSYHLAICRCFSRESRIYF